MNLNSTQGIDSINDILKKNCYEVFDLPQEYLINRELLDSKYRSLQKQFHPDSFINHPHSELSLMVSSHINNAYAILKSPLLRAIELLKCNDINLDLSTNTGLSHEFLIAQIELHEEIEEANQNINALKNIIKRLNAMQQELSNKIAQNFAKKNYFAIVDDTKQLAFYVKLENLVNTKIEELW